MTCNTEGTAVSEVATVVRNLDGIARLVAVLRTINEARVVFKKEKGCVDTSAADRTRPHPGRDGRTSARGAASVGGLPTGYHDQPVALAEAGG
eukprot:scaffold184_cov106-Isochrysis_galbana.AAC.4